MTTNIVPEHSDFNVVFSSITKDSTALTFSTVGLWRFAIGSDIDGAPLLHFDSVNNSGLFTISSGTRTVSVFISSTGFQASGGTDGRYYVALWAETSGSPITHEQKTIMIEKQLRRA
jgi:hypothetical protein